MKITTCDLKPVHLRSTQTGSPARPGMPVRLGAHCSGWYNHRPSGHSHHALCRGANKSDPRQFARRTPRTATRRANSNAAPSASLLDRPWLPRNSRTSSSRRAPRQRGCFKSSSFQSARQPRTQHVARAHTVGSRAVHERCDGALGATSRIFWRLRLVSCWRWMAACTVAGMRLSAATASRLPLTSAARPR